MREIGTTWQIGVLTGKPCIFFCPKWVIFGVLALQKFRKNKSHPLAGGLGWRSCGLPVVHQLIFSSRTHPRAPIGFWYRAPSSSRQLGFGVQQLKDSGSVGDRSLQVHNALTSSRTCHFKGQQKLVSQ